MGSPQQSRLCWGRLRCVKLFALCSEGWTQHCVCVHFLRRVACFLGSPCNAWHTAYGLGLPVFALCGGLERAGVRQVLYLPSPRLQVAASERHVSLHSAPAGVLLASCVGLIAASWFWGVHFRACWVGGCELLPLGATTAGSLCVSWRSGLCCSTVPADHQPPCQPWHSSLREPAAG